MSKYKPIGKKAVLWPKKRPVDPTKEKPICGKYWEYGFNNGKGCPKEPNHDGNCGYWEEKYDCPT